MKRALVIAAAVLALSLGSMAADKPMNKKELRELMLHASTKADHEKLARYFNNEADNLQAQADDHVEIARACVEEASKDPALKDASSYCTSMAQSLRTAAGQARALANAHSDMAKRLP